MPNRKADFIFDSWLVNTSSWAFENVATIALAITLYFVAGYCLAGLDIFNLIIETIGCIVFFGLPTVFLIWLIVMSKKRQLIRNKVSWVRLFSMLGVIALASFMLAMHINMSLKLKKCKQDFITVATRPHTSLELTQVIAKRDDIAQHYYIVRGWWTGGVAPEVCDVYIYNPFQKE